MTDTRNAIVGKWGLPREEDIRKLNDVFSDALKSPGTLIEYAAMAAAVNLPVGSGAFGGLAQKWKRQLRRERGILLTNRPSELHPHGTRSVGYYVADSAANADLSLDDHSRLGRASGRIVANLSTITSEERENLSPARRKTVAHLSRFHAELARRIQMETKTARIELHARTPLIEEKKAK